jgi:hypothetical protein
MSGVFERLTEVVVALNAADILGRAGPGAAEALDGALQIRDIPYTAA